MSAKSHPIFLKALRESEGTVDFIARTLERHGWEVHRPATRYAPTHEQWKQYSDGGDLYVRSPEDEDWRRWEIKGRSLDFTGVHDFPFRTVLVCTVHSYERADPKPELFVNVNKARTHVGVIRSSTRGSWTIADRGDRRHTGKEAVQSCYYVDKLLVEFRRIT